MSPKSLGRGQNCRGPGGAEEATAKVRGTWEVGGTWNMGPQGLHMRGKWAQAGPGWAQNYMALKLLSQPGDLVPDFSTLAWLHPK